MRYFENIFLIPGFVNCFLIEREDHCILIDAGMSKKAKRIIQKINEQCPNKSLKAIFVTHAHQDHTAGLKTLVQLYNSEVISHKEESRYIMKTEKFPARGGFSGLMLKILGKIMAIPACNVDKLVEDNETIHGLKVIHLPGHTPGTIALEDIETQALFCNDIINTDKKGTVILPPDKNYALNYDQAIKSSIRMFQVSKPKAIMPGHGSPILEPEESIKIYLEEYDKV
jgi:glyoxylase-like metal-dependent hydrolase (beta-lactamase superfamily II)